MWTALRVNKCWSEGACSVPVTSNVRTPTNWQIPQDSEVAYSDRRNDLVTMETPVLIKAVQLMYDVDAV